VLIAYSFRCHSDEDMLKLSDEHHAAEFSPKFNRSFAVGSSKNDDNGVVNEACSVAVFTKILRENCNMVKEMEATMASLEV
jgi:hypothetical protein